MRDENNRAARATTEHVWNAERIQCTMSFSEKKTTTNFKILTKRRAYNSESFTSKSRCVGQNKT